MFSYVYQLPGTRRFNSVVNGFLSGWSLAGITTIQSGAPLTLTGTNANNVFGITGDRAQLAPGCTSKDLVNSGSIQSKLTNYFNRPCILRNAAGTAIWTIVGDDGIVVR